MYYEEYYYSYDVVPCFTRNKHGSGFIIYFPHFLYIGNSSFCVITIGQVSSIFVYISL